LRRLVILLALSCPLLLVAAGPPVTSPDRAPGENDPGRHFVVPVQEWLAILPAPAGPEAPGSPHERWPLQGYVLTQPYGCTGFELERPAAECPGGFHTGIDLAMPQGTPIRAAGGGLAYPFQDDERYGNHVLVQEPGGISTVYGHMVRTAVAWGQAVRAGDVIGYVGSTGNSTGPHLHFEVRWGGVPVDPMPWLGGAPPDPGPLPAGWPGAPRNDWRGPR
jgi:murein DD-endopeptidase MepM/ murein hydrolase activator NlpD